MTALGIDNYGRMTYRYGYEEIDYVDGTQDWVWNAPNHVLFLRLRKLFDEELCDLYTTLESSGCWSATSLINQFNDWQMQFPEELWRLDCIRKYIRTYTESYIGGKAYPEFLTERANGRKKSQRSQFERNQEKYMSSKFGGTVASADDIILRCSVPNTTLVVEPNFDITLTAYSHVYASVKYNTDVRPYKYRLKPNETYTFEYNAELADIIEIYSASCLKDIGDLSACYLTNGTFANATKIKELTLGNDTEGYNNTNVMTLGLGSNELLNKLDIQNMSGLTHSLDLSGLKNLEELYAFGSGTSGVIFADGGNIKIAEIPDVGTLQMKNLNYLTDDGFDTASTYSLSRLVAEHSELDLIDLINNSPNLRQVRLTGIDWTLEDTSLLERLYGLAGVTNTGANTDQSVLTGIASVAVIGQYELYKYKEAWPDLVISSNSIIPQFAVTFKNYDGSILDVQYVNQFESAIDPVTRENNPIGTPVKESTIQYDYTYIGWDNVLTNIVEDRIITAVYKEDLREYTIQYVSKGIPVKTSTGLYGDNIAYDGSIPTYTLEEPTAFYLFKGWDKSGFLDGDFDENGIKTVNAEFDTFRYTSGIFNGKQLGDLKPIEIYALSKLIDPLKNNFNDYGIDIETGDDYSFEMGYDVDYGDIESELIISNKTYNRDGTNTVFTGESYIDTGIKLFDVDKDFVIAVDYKMSSENSSGATLMQCFQTSGSNGFKLTYTSSPQFIWGSSSITNDNGAVVPPSTSNSREMIVIRHKKGDNNLYVYVSNLTSDDIGVYTIEKNIATQSDNATLVFGAAKQDSGRFANYGIGEINWCKIWYKDLGESVCKELVGWIHEKITLEVSGFWRYQLYDDTTKESMMSLLATHLLGITKQYNSVSTNGNTGGWAESKLNAFLNNRFYNAIPYQIKALIKKVSVVSTVGGASTQLSSSGCFVTIPSLYDVNNDPVDVVYRSEVYDANGTINFMSGQVNTDSEVEKTNRIRKFDGGDANKYWLRSPNIGYTNYVWHVDANGMTQAITQANSNLGILIEISF